MRVGCSPRLVVRLAALLICGLIPFQSGMAVNPYRAELEIRGLRTDNPTLSNSKIVEEISPVKIKGRLKNLGFIEASFTQRRNNNWASFVHRRGEIAPDHIVPLLLRGKVAVGGGSVAHGRRVFATAAVVINKELKITFPGRVTGSRKSRQRIYTVRVMLDGSIKVSARISSVPAHAFHSAACGAAVGGEGRSGLLHGYATGAEDPIVAPLASEIEASSGATVGAVKASKVITISTDADPEWYAKYGDSSNAVIAGIINAAEAIYEQQLGIRFKIVQQHIYTDSSPYLTSDSTALLALFANNKDNPSNLGGGSSNFKRDVDLKHLFTGKDLDGSVIGIAYIGTVCSSPDYSYGITQDYVEGAIVGIFAHEVGHNLGAFHDTSARDGLMYPSISIPAATKFSDVSLNEISEYIGVNGACLSTEGLNDTTSKVIPNSAPARIVVHQNIVGSPRSPIYRISGRVFAQDGSPAEGVQMRYVVNDSVVGKVVSDRSGRYSILVKFSIPHGRQAYSFVETADGALASRSIWIGASKVRRRR